MYHIYYLYCLYYLYLSFHLMRYVCSYLYHLIIWLDLSFPIASYDHFTTRSASPSRQNCFCVLSFFIWSYYMIFCYNIYFDQVGFLIPPEVVPGRMAMLITLFLVSLIKRFFLFIFLTSFHRSHFSGKPLKVWQDHIGMSIAPMFNHSPKINRSTRSINHWVQ